MLCVCSELNLFFWRFCKFDYLFLVLCFCCVCVVCRGRIVCDIIKEFGIWLCLLEKGFCVCVLGVVMEFLVLFFSLFLLLIVFVLLLWWCLYMVCEVSMKMELLFFEIWVFCIVCVCCVIWRDLCLVFDGGWLNEVVNEDCWCWWW